MKYKSYNPPVTEQPIPSELTEFTHYVNMPLYLQMFKMHSNKSILQDYRKQYNCQIRQNLRTTQEVNTDSFFKNIAMEDQQYGQNFPEEDIT